MAGFIKRKDKQGRNVVFVKEWCITEEERKEVRELSSYGYIVKKAKQTKEKPADTYEITQDFNVPYDKVKKEHITEYVKKFVKDADKIKKFVKVAYKDKKTWKHITAKKEFFKIFFPERWENEISPMLENRKFKKSKKKAQDDFFAQYFE